jgi:hypothetical protein
MTAKEAFKVFYGGHKNMMTDSKVVLGKKAIPAPFKREAKK